MDAQPRDRAGRYTETAAADPGNTVLTDPAGAQCGPRCWRPVKCPLHGVDMPPRGHSLPGGQARCCERADNPAVNPRHLWDEHDDTRHYTDPAAWDRHQRSCDVCNPNGDDQ